MKKVAALSLILFSFLNINFQPSIYAQTISDALRYSILDNGTSTARGLGAGGALGALGADFSVATANPAGLANFRKSQFMITPQFTFNKTNSKLDGNETNKVIDEQVNKTNFSNIGLVLHGKSRNGNWTSISFGIGLNRTANYHQEITYRGSSLGSITDRFLELAQGLTPNEMDQFEGSLAYNSSAIFDKNPNDPNLVYTSDIAGYPEVNIPKNQNINTSGYTNELLFSLAGNYKDKFLIGATVGVPIIKYTESKEYQEIDYPEDSIKFFNALSFKENLNTTGGGFNLKLGTIYNINQNIRVGAAFHTPSVLTFTDKYSNELSYDYTDANHDGAIESFSPEGTFDYSIITPWRASGSVSGLINKYGFISAEVEYVDYAKARFDFNSTDLDSKDYENELNTEIKNNYKSAVNFRIGAEATYEIFKIRGGLGLISSPYQGDKQYSNVYSLGAGIYGKSLYFDFGYQTRKVNEGFEPYLTAAAPKQQVNTTSKTNLFLATIGFKF